MAQWTPHDINVLLHLYASRSPWPLGDTTAYRESVEKLFSRGLLTKFHDDYEASSLGEGLIALWCETPVPTTRYVDPRFGWEAV